MKAPALIVLAVVAWSSLTEAFIVTPCFPLVSRAAVSSRLSMTAQQPDGEAQNRRNVLVTAATSAVATAALLFVPVQAAQAAASTVPGADRLVTGYKQLTFLLDNWEKETTRCDANGKCDRNPDNVRRYLGLRSTTDPLFQIERILDKAQAYIDDPDDSDAYIEAAETFQSTQSMANSMAFTSSFGEYKFILTRLLQCCTYHSFVTRTV
jgi:hypothetical protein